MSEEKPEQREDEIEPTPADVEAAEEASDVMLEADDEAEGVEAASPSEAPRSGEETESESATTRGAADADAPSSPAPVAAGEPEAPVGPAAPAEVAEAPAKPRRRRRRGAAEAEAEPPAGGAVASEPEAPAVEAPAIPAPAPPAQTAPGRRRRREQPAGPPPVVRAKARYVRSSARKARLVCDHIRGKSVEEARAILAHTPRAVARDWSKLLESAVANAEHNHELVGEDLYVKSVHADEGPTIRRFQPRAMGRATRIRKRTSHLTILLTPKE
jgi:large subunit ribosomal protein L22